MKPNVDDLERIVDGYLAGAQRFWDFYHAFMSMWADADLADEEVDRWEPVYDVVYMAAPDPVGPEDRDVGIVGESDLKFRLGELRGRPA